MLITALSYAHGELGSHFLYSSSPQFWLITVLTITTNSAIRLATEIHSNYAWRAFLLLFLVANRASLRSAGRREEALGYRLTPLRERFGGQKRVLAGGAELDDEVSRVFLALARLNRGVSLAKMPSILHHTALIL